MLIHFMFQYHNMLNKCMCRNDAGHWFSPGTPVSSINKTDHHNIAEILLKVASNTINPLYVPNKAKAIFLRKIYLINIQKLQ